MWTRAQAAVVKPLEAGGKILRRRTFGVRQAAAFAGSNRAPPIASPRARTGAPNDSPLPRAAAELAQRARFCSVRRLLPSSSCCGERRYSPPPAIATDVDLMSQ
jgi:hypothetical protein